MAKTDKESAQYSIAKIEAIEQVLNIAFPSFALDYVEQTKRNVLLDPVFSSGSRSEIEAELNTKLTELKAKRPK